MAKIIRGNLSGTTKVDPSVGAKIDPTVGSRKDPSIVIKTDSSVDTNADPSLGAKIDPSIDVKIDPDRLGNVRPIGVKLPSAFPVIDFTVGQNTLAGADGTVIPVVSDAIFTNGPGKTVMGNLNGSLDFQRGGRAVADISAAAVNFKLFAVRVCFQVTAPVNGRQNIVESDKLPFSVFLEKTNLTTDFKVIATIGSQTYGWVGIDSSQAITLKVNAWYVADLLFSLDTIALFINSKPAGVLSIKNSALLALNGSKVYIGTWVDGQRNHFPGKIAGLQLFHNIPAELLAPMEKSRQSPDWFLTEKASQLKGALGIKQGAVKKNMVSGYDQEYQYGLIQFTPILGVSFTLVGLIFKHYGQLSQVDKQELGFLVSDEVNTTSFRGRKSLFRSGAIYWSNETGAIKVTGQLFLDYEGLGETALLGFPKTAVQNIPGGQEQDFEYGRMYYRSGAPKSFEVHGAILARYILIGGYEKLGYPVSDEMDIIKPVNIFDNTPQVVGKVSYFEYGKIYYSDETGAFEVYGDIGTAYDGANGPIGQLGFPTSGELDIPGGGRYNTFQHGSITHFGSIADTYVCLPFRIHLETIDSVEWEGVGMAQNDLTADIYIEGLPGGNYHTRYPKSGYYSDKNIININDNLQPVITPNYPGLSLTFRADIWEIDDPGDNDLIAYYSHPLNISNAWGLRGNMGIFDESCAPRLKHILWSIAPDVNIKTLTAGQKWWGVKNFGIDQIPYNLYATAFNNVDSETEWYDVTDWLDKAFYELVIKDLAKGGRCAGMCIEAILSLKKSSLFSMPINRFNNMDITGDQFTTKHQRQVGAAACWWFVGEYLSGTTHDPKSVFEQTRFAHSLGQDPIICLAQNYNFSGAPHVVLPYAWEKDGDTWMVKIYDPNFPSDSNPENDPTRIIYIDANSNTFSYQGASDYSGGTWTGGRFYYLPWLVVNSRPRTPVWDAILLLLAGTMVILGDSATTDSLTDSDGTALDYSHPEVTERLKAGQSIDNRFFPFKGFFGDDTSRGTLYMRKGINSGKFVIQKPGEVHNSDFIHKVTGKPGSQQPFNYAVKSMFSETKISAPIAAGEQMTVNIKNLHLPTYMVGLSAQKDKNVDLNIVNKLSTGSDHFRLQLDQLPVGPGKDIQINIKPGLGGIEIIPGSASLNSKITLETVIGNTKQVYQYRIREEGGVRIHPASIAGQGELLVSKIDHIFGPALDLKTLKKL